MSKLDEKHYDKGDQSAAEQGDLEFETWLNQRVHDEAAEMIDELEVSYEPGEPDPEEEESFQKFLQRARAEGLIEENTKSTKEKITKDTKEIKETREESEEISELLREADEADKEVSTSKPKVVHYGGFRRKITRFAVCAAAVVIIICIKPIYSQANKIFLIEKEDEIRDNNVNTKVNNAEDILKSDSSEEDARELIKKTLNLEVPSFYYLPDKMIYDSCQIDENAHNAFMAYKYKEDIIYLQIMQNENEKSGIYKNDQGIRLEPILTEYLDFNVEMWKIEKDGDKAPTYLAQWDYKNWFYCFSGKIEEKEMREIIKKMIY